MTLRNVARDGDTVAGVCNNHSSPTDYVGIWVINRPNFTNGSRGVVLVGDTCPVSCGHTAIAVEGSSKFSNNGISVHRMGDAIDIVGGGGPGTTTSGSSTFISD